MYRFQILQAMFPIDTTKFDVNYKKLSSQKIFQNFLLAIHYKIIMKYNNKIILKNFYLYLILPIV